MQFKVATTLILVVVFVEFFLWVKFYKNVVKWSGDIDDCAFYLGHTVQYGQLSRGEIVGC